MQRMSTTPTPTKDDPTAETGKAMRGLAILSPHATGPDDNIVVWALGKFFSVWVFSFN
jgi:hypothetical protein